MKLKKEDKKWRIGDNIAQVINFTAIPREEDVIYIATLRNLHGIELKLSYMVPHKNTPGQLIKDLKELSTFKPWLVIKLIENNGLPSITNITVVKEPEDLPNLAAKMRLKVN